MYISIFISLLSLLINCEPEQSVNNQVVPTESIANTQQKIFTAKVIRIVDGDTLEVLYAELPIMIRLEHIDCPEKRGKQPYGNAAKKALSDLCSGQEVKVEWNGDKDRNGRYISVIYNQNGINANQEMVRLGMAWHFKKYSTDEEYAKLENEARKNKVGLWQDPNPVPPWEWRK